MIYIIKELIIRKMNLILKKIIKILDGYHHYDNFKNKLRNLLFM
jgi:hypothetical protein